MIPHVSKSFSFCDCVVYCTEFVQETQTWYQKPIGRRGYRIKSELLAKMREQYEGKHDDKEGQRGYNIGAFLVILGRQELVCDLIIIMSWLFSYVRQQEANGNKQETILLLFLTLSWTEQPPCAVNQVNHPEAERFNSFG